MELITMYIYLEETLEVDESVTGVDEFDCLEKANALNYDMELYGYSFAETDLIF